jgi:carbon-monoxide dehydrogenase large subunit
MMQNLFAKHLGLEEQQVRVITKDVGGSFGIKVHTYATRWRRSRCRKLLRRPVKFVAGPARKLRHRHPRARPSREGKDRRQARRHDHAWEIDDLTGIGPVFGLSAHLRASRPIRS